MSQLDILDFVALDNDSHLLRVTNDQFLDFVETRLAPLLTDAQNALYAKLLTGDRARYMAADAMDFSLNEAHADRYARYRDRSATLARLCSDALLAKVGKTPPISAIVTNTTVGGTIPSLSSIVGGHVNVARNGRLVDLGYMGCAAALLALEIVEQQLKPGETGIVLSVELTSIMTNLCPTTDASLVANTVFGDGVGAFLVARRPHSHRAMFHLKGHASDFQTDPDALAAITYEPNAAYHEIRLQRTIADVAARGVRKVMEQLVRSTIATPTQKLRFLVAKTIPEWQKCVDYAVLHTAGRRILADLSLALDLTDQQSRHNFAAFHAYSNTSSASIYYTLTQLRREQALKRGETLLFLAYGSGFMTRGLYAQAA